jgi:hypothetical protein
MKKIFAFVLVAGLLASFSFANGGAVATSSTVNVVAANAAAPQTRRMRRERRHLRRIDRRETRLNRRERRINRRLHRQTRRYYRRHYRRP